MNFFLYFGRLLWSSRGGKRRRVLEQVYIDPFCLQAVQYKVQCFQPCGTVHGVLVQYTLQRTQPPVRNTVQCTRPAVQYTVWPGRRYGTRFGQVGGTVHGVA